MAGRSWYSSGQITLALLLGLRYRPPGPEEAGGSRVYPDVLYHEYKFHVADAALAPLLRILHSLYQNSDPYPAGIVDSIYYDTACNRFYDQCLNGAMHKLKLRIRGYGSGSYVQAQIKEKNIFGVNKLKANIVPASLSGQRAPMWEELRAGSGASDDFAHLRASASCFGPLRPVVRVRYLRHRFRLQDYRLTLDTDIQITGMANAWRPVLGRACVPHHVLEIKSGHTRPHLPFLGVIKLAPISFSKFFYGQLLLQAKGDI